MTHNTITKKDLFLGTGVLAIAFMAQPFFMMMSQRYLAPKLAQIFSPEAETAGLGGKIDLAGTHLRGNPNAKVFLVEYSDFECPFCKSFHPTANNAVNNSNGEVAMIYKNYPLPFHPNALPAAIAAECVAKLAGEEKYFAYSDILFNNQETLSPALLQNTAAKIGINLPQFNNCLKDPAMSAKVNADQEEGSSFGVQGTPNTFVAKKIGEKLVFVANINGAQPQAVVDALVKENLNKDPNIQSSSLWSRIKKAFF